MTEELEKLRLHLERILEIADKATPTIIRAIAQKRQALFECVPIEQEPELLAYQFEYDFHRAVEPFGPNVLEVFRRFASVTNLARTRMELRYCVRRLAELDEACRVFAIELQDRNLDSWSTGATLLDRAHSDWILWLSEVRDLTYVATDALDGISSEIARVAVTR